MATNPSGTIFGHRDVYSKVELSIACTNLKDMDVFSKSDPVVFVYEKNGLNWIKMGRTEVIDNNLNPKVCSQLSYIQSLSISLIYSSNTVFQNIHYELSF